MGQETKPLRMPEPPADKEALKVNVYEFGRNLVSTLTPMFPYIDEGAMVPTCAFFYGAPNGDYGYFEHDNTVDEVAVIFGAGDTTGRGRGGLARVSARSHGVGNLLNDPDNPASFAFVTVTQRQSIGVKQHEAVSFACEKCATQVFRMEYDATPPKRGRQREEAGPVAHLHTLVGSAKAAETYNSDAKNRTCPKCGHVNKPFPLHRWGWDRYVAQTTVMNEAYKSLLGPAKQE